MRVSTWIRRALLAAALLLVLVLLSGGAWWLCEPRFVERLLTYPADAPVTTVGWYEPREAVPGGGAGWPAERGPTGLARAPLERAAAWAAEHASAAFVVVHRGELAFESYAAGHSAELPLNSFSLAKTLLGLLVGTACERGELALDDPIGRWLPEWRDDPRGAITVDDLLRMQSGLRYDNDRSNPLSDMVRVHLADDLLPTLLAVELERAPGTAFRYSNLESQLLGVVLERATGRRWAELLSARLWQPLGAADASVWLDREQGQAKTYCCVFATARDWALVGELILRRGSLHGRSIVPAAWIERMLEPGLDPSYGRHVWLRPASASLPARVVIDGKAKQRVWILPELELVIVRLGEEPESWDEDRLPELVARAARGEAPAAAK